MRDLQPTSEDWINEYYTDYFQGHPVIFIRNKFTGEVHVNADSLIRCLGLGDSFEEFIGSDKGLDFINEWKRDHPGVEFWGNAVIRSGNQNSNN